MLKDIKLIFYPNKKLFEKSKRVNDPTKPEIQELIREMLKIMREEKGVGISAIQVNVPLSIVIAEYQDQCIILINPKIYKKSIAKEIDLEGCLSLPGVYGPVKRHKSIKVSGLNEKGETVNITAKNLFSRVIQHEIDHTKGIIFIDKMVKSKESRKVLKKLQDLTDKM